MIIVPATGELSASVAFRTTSLYQPGKSTDCLRISLTKPDSGLSSSAMWLRSIRALRSELLLVLFGDRVQFTEQRGHQFLFRKGADDLAVLEEDALVLAAGDADVGVLALTRPVDDAAHHG